MPKLSQRQIQNLITSLSHKLEPSIISIDNNLTNDDNTVASQKATKEYIDNEFFTIPSILHYRGTFDVNINDSFADLGFGNPGDLYIVEGNAIIDTIPLNNSDMIMIINYASTILPSDVYVIKNPENLQDIYYNTDVVNDDSFSTASDITIPTSSSVKNYVDSYANKKESFSKILHEDIPTGTIIFNNDYVIELLMKTSLNTPIEISIDGLKLRTTEYTHISGTNIVTINVAYDIDSTDIIRIIYTTDTTLLREGYTITFSGSYETYEFATLNTNPSTIIIDGNSFIINSLGSSLQFDAYVFTYIGEQIAIDIGLNSYVVQLSALNNFLLTIWQV